MAAQVSLWLACAGLFFAGLVFLAVGEKQFAQRLHGFIVQTIPESMDGLSGGTARFQKWEWLVLGATILAALLLRSFHLDNLYPYADEYSHLNAAKQILNGTSIFTAYQRGMYMVTLPVVLAFKMFGSQVWAARVPGVLVNSLALLPLYLLSRKINRSTAILAIFLYATNPWIITVARSIREYGYIPFYSFWILYGMLLVLENMPRRIVLDRRILTQIHKNWVVPLILLILPVMYIFKIDSFSTFKVFLMAYGIFALFVLARVDMKARENFLPLAGILVLLGLGGFVYISNLGFVSFKLVLFTAPLRLFFPNPEQQWYHDRLNFLPLLAFFFAVVAAVWQVRRNPAPLFLVVQFGTFLTFFLLFFSRYYRPKYLFSVEILLIPVLAFGFSILWLILKISMPRKGIQIGAACLALLATINPAQSILPSRFDLNGLMPISQEYHYDVSVVDEYMRQNAKPSDALVSTIYRSYVSFKGEPVFLAKSGFQQDNPGEIEVLAQFMQKYPSGWLVLDLHRYRSWTQQLPQTQFELKGIPVKYMGEYHEQYVWKWGE